MKTISIVIRLVVIAGIVGVIALVGRNEKLKSSINSFNAERDAYRSHHKPVEGWYYSVESVSTEPVSKKTFIIGRNMQPLLKKLEDGTVSISLEPNGRLYEVEVPVRTAGLKSVGAYFTVKTVDRKRTLIYFPNEQEVIKSMIHARDTSGT